VETGPALGGMDRSTFLVRRFCEKPSLELAELLYERGALWNTFVMVGHVGAYLKMTGSARSGLMKAFPGHHLWAGAEVRIPDWIYDRVYATDFSREVLSTQTHRLLAQRLSHLVWNDLGQPERVMDVLQAAGLKPWWMKEWCALRRPPGMEIPVANSAVA
jgi:mannose-1-phosphate guanylyltransferase